MISYVPFPIPYPSGTIGPFAGQTLTRIVRCEQERPCTRCIKRNIGHLCHDEPREQETKKSKSLAPSTVQDAAPQPDPGPSSSSNSQNAVAMKPSSFDSAMGNGLGQTAKAAFDAAALADRSNNPIQLVQPTSVPSIASSALGAMSQCRWLEFPPEAPSVSEARRS